MLTITDIIEYFNMRAGSQNNSDNSINNVTNSNDEAYDGNYLFAMRENQENIQSDLPQEKKAKNQCLKQGIHPYNFWRRAWEYFIYFVSLLVLWEIPFAWTYELEIKLPLAIITISLDLIYLLDYFICFSTGYMNHGIIELNLQNIRQHIPMWRKIIFLATPFPFHLFGFFSKKKYVYEILMTIHIIRVLRLYEAAVTIKNTLSYINPASKIIMLFSVLFTIIHFFSCIFWVVGNSELPGESWLSYTGITNETQIDQYFHTFYYMTTTCFTIGYGDIHPYTLDEIIVVIFAEGVGVFFYSFLVSNMVSIVADPSRNNFITKYQRISSALQYRGVSKESLRELMKYYEYAWERDRDRDGFFNAKQKLPPSIQKRLSAALHMEIFEKINSLSKLPLDVLQDFGSRLKPKIYIPGDFIVKAGKVSDRILFITNGKVDIFNSQSSLLTSFNGEPGCVLGENSLLTGAMESTCAVAGTCVEAFELLKGDFDEIINNYESFKYIVERYRQSASYVRTIGNRYILSNNACRTISNLNESPP